MRGELHRKNSAEFQVLGAESKDHCIVPIMCTLLAHISDYEDK
jgi:hypothetical protein